MPMLTKNRGKPKAVVETPKTSSKEGTSSNENASGKGLSKAYIPVATRAPRKSYSISINRSGQENLNKNVKKAPPVIAMSEGDDDSTTDDEFTEDQPRKRKASWVPSSSKKPSAVPLSDSGSEEMEVDVENGNTEEDSAMELRKSAQRDVNRKSKSILNPDPVPSATAGKSKVNDESKAKAREVIVDEPDSEEELFEEVARKAPGADIIISSVSDDEEGSNALSDDNDDVRSESMSGSPSPALNIGRNRRGSGQENGDAGSYDNYGSEYSVDPNDPEWLKFDNDVKKNAGIAHRCLAKDLMESSNPCALLAKLQYRAISSDVDGNSESIRLCEKYGVTIIKAILHISIDNDNKSGQVVDLVNMLFSELRHFRTSVIQSVLEYCLDYIKKDKDRTGSLPSRWIEIFGKLVLLISNRGDIKHETDVMNGEEYREFIVAEICGSKMNWTSENTASLLAIIREIPGIDGKDLKLVIVHIKSILKNIKPTALPPIVHQLIMLAAENYPSDLLSMCAEYFENVDFSNTESIDVKQKRNALGTVVFHFLEAARHKDALVKAVVNFVKASFFDFAKAMTPFILSVVLALMHFGHIRAAIFDRLRNSIMNSFHSHHLSEMSYWHRHKIGDAEDVVTPCFAAVLESKSSELEYMFSGIRDIAIGLLNADSFQSKYPNTLEKCQSLGSYLITSLVKNCPDQLPLMITSLLKLPFKSKSSVQTECLAKCLEMRTRQIIHPSNIGKTCDIIHQLPMMESTAAEMIVRALSNAFNLSYILLDQLMINLRKTVWKSLEARKTAARIMIILLSNSRIVGDIPFSQYSESQRFFSDSQQSRQLSSGQLPDNQPLCIEVLLLAKRALQQQCVIREELYLGFHYVVRKNPGLCELICSHLYKHAIQYLDTNSLDATGVEGNAESPLIYLGKVVEFPTGSGTALGLPPIIKEELGFLVQCLSFVVNKSHQAFHTIDDGPPAAVENLEKLLQQWITAVLKTTATTIEMAASDTVANAGGSRPLNSVRFVESAFTIQLMQVIEALIEFLNLENKPRNGKIVKKLYERYTTLEPLLNKEKEKVGSKEKGKGDKGTKDKTKGKGQKGAKDKDVNVSDDTITDDASETSENQNPRMKLKKPDAPKKLTYFHIITLESALDMLSKIQKADVDKGAMLEVHRSDFERLLISTVKQKLTNFKKKESLRERRRQTAKIVETFADIAGCFWNGLLMYNSEAEDSVGALDISLVELRLDLVNEIVTYLCSHHLHVCKHLIKVFSDDESDNSYKEIFPKFFNSWKTLYGWLPSIVDGAEDGDKTVYHHLFDILQAFGRPLPPDSDSNEQNIAGEILKWIWKYMSSPSGKNFRAEFLLADSVVSCWLTYYMKAKDFLEQPGRHHHDVFTLAVGVKQIMGIQEECDTQYIANHDPVNMWIINEETAPRVFCTIMNHIEGILDHLMKVLAKLKSNEKDDDVTQNKIGLLRGSCFTKIDEVISVCSPLVISRFPAGLCSTTVLKVIPQIFTVMNGFGEYLLELIKTKRPYSLKGFAKPVAKIGTNFKPLVESMIHHLELVQRESAFEAYQKAGTSKNSRGVTKVPSSVKNQLLKERTLIPNFIYAVEKYDQMILSLTRKGEKEKLIVGMKLSIARDFKIQPKELLEAMKEPRSVQEMTTVPDEESNMEIVNNDATGAGRSKSRSAPRVRKPRKRKATERDGDEEEEGDNNGEQEQ